MTEQEFLRDALEPIRSQLKVMEEEMEKTQLACKSVSGSENTLAEVIQSAEHATRENRSLSQEINMHKQDVSKIKTDFTNMSDMFRGMRAQQARAEEHQHDLAQQAQDVQDSVAGVHNLLSA